jgi:hypothetical protein
MMDVTKDQIVFVLSRHAKMAKARTEFDHEAAAKRGMPYEQRTAMTEAAKDSITEAACLEKALEIVKSCESL